MNIWDFIFRGGYENKYQNENGVCAPLYSILHHLMEFADLKSRALLSFLMRP